MTWEGTLEGALGSGEYRAFGVDIAGAFDRFIQMFAGEHENPENWTIVKVVILQNNEL